MMLKTVAAIVLAGTVSSASADETALREFQRFQRYANQLEVKPVEMTPNHYSDWLREVRSQNWDLAAEWRFPTPVNLETQGIPIAADRVRFLPADLSSVGEADTREIEGCESVIRGFQRARRLLVEIAQVAQEISQSPDGEVPAIDQLNDWSARLASLRASLLAAYPPTFEDPFRIARYEWSIPYSVALSEGAEHPKGGGAGFETISISSPNSLGPVELRNGRLAHVTWQSLASPSDVCLDGATLEIFGKFTTVGFTPGVGLDIEKLKLPTTVPAPMPMPIPFPIGPRPPLVDPPRPIFRSRVPMFRAAFDDVETGSGNVSNGGLGAYTAGQAEVTLYYRPY